MSPRPKRTRKVLQPPGFRGFKPFGCPDSTDNKIKLLLEEYEAVNLADYEKLSQEEAAKQMGVSRPTFSRIYESARGKIARAFMEVSTIVIEGGNVEIGEDWLHCTSCHTIFKLSDPQNQSHTCPVCQSRETEKINTPESAESVSARPADKGRCICPKCDFSLTHIPGQPCRSNYCPNCGISMIRENSSHHKQLIKKIKK
jgi:uncharacterized protein